jgi:hypothetical protein
MGSVDGFAAAAPPAVFRAPDFPVNSDEYFTEERNCFQLKANFCILRFSPVFSALPTEEG